MGTLDTIFEEGISSTQVSGAGTVFDVDTGDGGTGGDGDTGDTGQESGSPPGNTKSAKPADASGQESGSPPGKGASGDGSPPPSDKSDKDISDKSTPLPYDQDPKWKAARKAEKDLHSLLQSHGYDNVEDLQQALSEGSTLKQLLGDKDAKDVVEGYQRLKQYEAYWAEQEALNKEQGETPAQTIERLKREKAQLHDQIEDTRSTAQSRDKAENAMAQYTSVVDGVLRSDGEGLGDAESAFLRDAVLAMDNPLVNVDIENRAEVKKGASSLVKTFRSLIDSVRQSAIDEYAKGKSSITPTPKDPGTGPVTPVQKRKSSPTSNVDATFDDARSELMEVLEKAVENA